MKANIFQSLGIIPMIFISISIIGVIISFTMMFNGAQYILVPSLILPIFYWIGVNINVITKSVRPEYSISFTRLFIINSVAPIIFLIIASILPFKSCYGEECLASIFLGFPAIIISIPITAILSWLVHKALIRRQNALSKSTV
jgi:hypothetical protein